MDDDRLPEKIEIVRRALAGAVRGREVEYLAPMQNGHVDRHLFRAGRRSGEHRLWLDQVFLEDCAVAELEGQLTVFEVPMLFAMTTRGDVLLESTLRAPRLVERLEDEPRARRGART